MLFTTVLLKISETQWRIRDFPDGGTSYYFGQFTLILNEISTPFGSMNATSVTKGKKFLLKNTLMFNFTNNKNALKLDASTDCCSGHHYMSEPRGML